MKQTNKELAESITKECVDQIIWGQFINNVEEYLNRNYPEQSVEIDDDKFVADLWDHIFSDVKVDGGWVTEGFGIGTGRCFIFKMFHDLEQKHQDQLKEFVKAVIKEYESNKGKN